MLAAEALPTTPLAPLADAALLPPKEPGGFNIEALAATPGGKLLIGLRNPVPAGEPFGSKRNLYRPRRSTFFRSP